MIKPISALTEAEKKLVIPSPTSSFFSSRRVTKLKDVKAGRYIRLWFQPLWRDNCMFSIEERVLTGRPFVSYSTFSIPAWKINAPSRKYGEPEEFLSSLGICDRRLFDEQSVQLFRFSNRLLAELNRIKAMGDFGAFCWFYNMPPTLETKETFNHRVSYAHWQNSMSEALRRAAYEKQYPETRFGTSLSLA